MAGFTESIRSVNSLLTRIIWLVVVGLLAAGLGWWFLDGRGSSTTSEPRFSEVIEPIDWTGVDAAVVAAVATAHTNAEQHTRTMLTQWKDERMVRVDESFLDWYFSYWNQNVLGMKALWYQTVHAIHSGSPDAAERITREIQEEFAARVLRPNVAQLELEQMSRAAMQTYVSSLQEELRVIPEQYELPAADWDRYLADLSQVTVASEGQREVPLTLKAVVTTASAVTLVTTARMAPYASRVASSMGSRLAGRAAAGTAAKSGAKVAGQAGGKLLGPIIGIGVVAWDVWDHQSTKRRERPLLRENIADYFDEMIEVLVNEPSSGLLSPIHDMELHIREAQGSRIPT